MDIWKYIFPHGITVNEAFYYICVLVLKAERRLSE